MKNKLLLPAIFIVMAIYMLAGCLNKSDLVEIRINGLIGAYYGDPDLTNIKESEILTKLDQYWDEETGHGSSWSGKWQGMLKSSITGMVTIEVSSSRHVELKVDNQQLIVDNGKASMQINMKQTEPVPIEIVYLHTKEETAGGFQVVWSWDGRAPTIIPANQFYFTEKQGIAWNYLPEPREEERDYRKFKKVKAKNVVVFDEPGKFGGWPANNGIWIWDNEILVGFTLAYYQEKELHHSVDETKPSQSVLARSLDGGETWMIEDPENFMGDGGELKILDEPINFSHPEFALRCNGRIFYFSYDKGKHWQGPYEFPDFGRKKITSRTDYLVADNNTCYFFFSTDEKKVQARLQDHTFCAITTDGGKTFSQLGWIGEPASTRSVMPSSVRLSDTHIVTALRRRLDAEFPDKPKMPHNWIDVYESKDDGKNWQFLSKVAETDMGKHNGNPPCLMKMLDGRLCVTYGYRALPYGIRAKISKDNGQTWGETLHIRDDGRNFDLGYTRSVQRRDGKIVTIYYYTTEQNKEQHIAASIWDPDSIADYSL